MNRKDSTGTTRQFEMSLSNKENMRAVENLSSGIEQSKACIKTRSRTPIISSSSRGYPSSSSSRTNLNSLFSQVQVAKRDFDAKKSQKVLKIKRARVDKLAIPQDLYIHSRPLDDGQYRSEADCMPRSLNVQAEEIEMSTTRIMEMNCRGLISDTDRATMYKFDARHMFDESSFVDGCSFDRFMLQTIDRAGPSSMLKRDCSLEQSKVDSIEHADCVGSLLKMESFDEYLKKSDSCFPIVCQSVSELSFRGPLNQINKLNFDGNNNLRSSRIPFDTIRKDNTSNRNINNRINFSYSHIHESLTQIGSMSNRDYPVPHEPTLTMPSRPSKRHYNIRTRMASKSPISRSIKYQPSILTSKPGDKRRLIDDLKNYR